MLILAVLFYVAGAYALTAPDPWTLRATRGSAQGVRAFFSAAADRSRTLSGPVPDPPRTAKRTPQGTGPRTRPGSKGTGPDRGSASTLWDRVRSALRTGVRLARSAWTGALAVPAAYRSGADRATEKRYGPPPDETESTPDEAPTDTPPKESETPMNIDVDTNGPGEYVTVADILEDNEILEQLSSALIDAQTAFTEHTTGMVSKYEAANWGTVALTSAMSSLSEVGETGFTEALEISSVIGDAIGSATRVTEAVDTEGAEGDTSAFASS